MSLIQVHRNLNYESLYCNMHSLHWRHNRRDGVLNHQPHHCLPNLLFRHRRKTSKIRVTSLCARTSPVTGEFPAQRASNAENVSIWWRHHVLAPIGPQHTQESNTWCALCCCSSLSFWLILPIFFNIQPALGSPCGAALTNIRKCNHQELIITIQHNKAPHAECTFMEYIVSRFMLTEMRLSVLEASAFSLTCNF